MTVKSGIPNVYLMDTVLAMSIEAPPTSYSTLLFARGIESEDAKERITCLGTLTFTFW